MNEEIKRVPVFRYDKSGKLTAIYSNGKSGRYTAIDLSHDLQQVISIRNPRYIKQDAISSTPYHAEFRIIELSNQSNIIEQEFHLLRVLTTEDLDENRWKNTNDLNSLPVSPEPTLTKEERLWAGEREGNIGWGIVLATIVVGGAVLSVQSFIKDDSYIFFGIVTAISGYFLIKYKWKVPIKALPSKLEMIQFHKKSLRNKNQSEYQEARTEFEKSLEDFSTWENLSPHNFELALSIRLENEGYKVAPTRYSQDGGVDIEAEDKQGRAIIVQAKQLNKNVGVSVVREMIGVRQSRQDTPHTIIYSLMGFSRGAKELAEQEDVELRDIKSELLKV